MSDAFLRIYSRVATHPRLFAISQKFASLGTFLLAPFSDHVRLPAFTGWGYSKELPRFAGKTFQERFQYQPSRSKLRSGEGSPSKEMKTLRSAQGDINRVDQFIDELTKVSGQVVRASKEEVTGKVVELLQSRNINRIHLEPNVLDEESLQRAGIAVSRERDASVPVGVTPHVSFQYGETCGVTKAICGLADTGSVLEADGEGGKLFASLLTEAHVAILHESDIYPSLTDAIHLTRKTKSAAFITGPSRTGDIEMSHTIGVHGPGEVIVFLVA